ncbi:mitochondrial 2-oxoglutarate/malate carrier protein-like [Teleopsis dalmanni]|uniref:mitochondrial 2-oxoglutarate/malate carrier protein-like n=1 Tax=Teleopsis dalmanni TaxID=139649 RepID=UPI0018CDBB98|nr:mitochondrial 2-oxoglutarate/malate carrier protein-like [Teleopsis dalmanni]
MSESKSKAEPPPSQKQMPNALKFFFGGLAGICGAIIVQPFDVVKTRMQVSVTSSGKNEFNSSFHCAQTIFASEGVLGLYRGLSAAILRQATYTTTRLGIYTYLNGQYEKTYESKPTVLASMLIGVVAGSIGAMVGTPTEVALIRMQADGRLPPAERRNYTNVFNALSRVIKEEGVASLYRGCFPTTVRAAIVNVSQLASYTQFKMFFNKQLNMPDGFKVQFASSMLSGLLTTLTSMPMDMAKTRIQSMKIVDGKAEYSGSLDVLLKVVRKEGVFAPWKGITPYFLRLGQHTIYTLLFLEQFTRMYYKYVLGDDKRTGL